MPAPEVVLVGLLLSIEDLQGLVGILTTRPVTWHATWTRIEVEVNCWIEQEQPVALGVVLRLLEAGKDGYRTDLDLLRRAADARIETTFPRGTIFWESHLDETIMPALFIVVRSLGRCLGATEVRVVSAHRDSGFSNQELQTEWNDIQPRL